MQSKKRKIITAFGAVALTSAIALSGTYAWQSVRQKALNQSDGGINPGARLHDDFDGQNKDVYVENFTDPEKRRAYFCPRSFG